MVGAPPCGEVETVAPVHEVQLGSPHVAVGPRRPLASRETILKLSYSSKSVFNLYYSLSWIFELAPDPILFMTFVEIADRAKGAQLAVCYPLGYLSASCCQKGWLFRFSRRGRLGCHLALPLAPSPPPLPPAEVLSEFGKHPEGVGRSEPVVAVKCASFPENCIILTIFLSDECFPHS